MGMNQRCRFQLIWMHTETDKKQNQPQLQMSIRNMALKHANGSERWCLCMCAWVCLRARACRASSCLMSWEAGHRRKTVMVSCWGVVSTLWWPCFRTHTYTHKEVDGGQGGVWKEEDGVRTEDNKRRTRSSYFFFFQRHIYIARVDTAPPPPPPPPLLVGSCSQF